MPGKRRGLVAPQNTFLDSIIRKTAAMRVSFLLANAHFEGHPVVFVSPDFSTLTGYAKSEFLGKSCVCPILHGDKTNRSEIDRMKTACDEHQSHQSEVHFYRRNQAPLVLRINVVPVKDENSQVCLLLLAFKDNTNAKCSMEEDSKGLGKFAWLARSISRNRSNAMESLIGSPGLKESAPNSSSQHSSYLRDETQKVFENLRQYKQEPPKTPPFIILHYSTFKTTWDWFILLLTFYTAVMVPANIAFQNKSLENIPLVILDSFVDLIFFLDIFLSFHTTIVGKSREVIADPRVIRGKYVKSWFIIDLLSCLPYDAFNSFKNTSHETGGSTVLNALKVLRLLRLGRIARKLDHYLEYGAAMLILLVLVYILIAHWMACVWYTLGISEVREGITYGWISGLSRTMEVPLNLSRIADNEDSGGGEFPKFMSYVTALYFTLSCITSVGFGNVSANTEFEKIFTIVGMLLGSLLYATIFGNITTIFQQLYSATARYQEMLTNARNFMRLHNVPSDLSNRVIDYIVSRWSMTKGVDPDAVLAYCPKDMKADICVHLSREVFDGNPAFRLANEGCLRAIAIHLITNHIAPGDIVIRQGEIIDYLFFVVSGTLEVTYGDQIVALLHKGDVFGDPFWEDATSSMAASTVTVKTLTYSDVHHIKREKLRDVLDFHTVFAKSFARNMVLSYDLRRKFDCKRLPDLNAQNNYDEPAFPKPGTSRKNFVNKIRRVSTSFSLPSGSLHGLPNRTVGASFAHQSRMGVVRQAAQEDLSEDASKSVDVVVGTADVELQLETSPEKRSKFFSVEIPQSIGEMPEETNNLIRLDDDHIITLDDDVFARSDGKFSLASSSQNQHRDIVSDGEDNDNSAATAAARRLRQEFAQKVARHNAANAAADVLVAPNNASDKAKDAVDTSELYSVLKLLVVEVSQLSSTVRENMNNLNERLSSAESQLLNLHNLVNSKDTPDAGTEASKSRTSADLDLRHTLRTVGSADSTTVGKVDEKEATLNSEESDEKSTRRSRISAISSFPIASFEHSTASSPNLNGDRVSNSAKQSAKLISQRSDEQ